MRFDFKSFKDIDKLLEFKIVVIVSNKSDFFKTKVMKALADKFPKPVHIDGAQKSPKDVIDTLRYNPLFSDKWFVDINQSTLTQKSLDYYYEEYMMKPFNNTFMLISSNDSKYNQLLERSKVIRRSKDVAYINLTYPIHALKREYILDYFNNLSYKIDDYALNLIIKRIGTVHEELDSSLSMLTVSCSATRHITGKDVVDVVEDKETYGVRDLIDAIVRLNRVKIPFDAINTLTEEYDIPYIRKAIRNSLENLEQAKELLLLGLTRQGSVKKFDYDYIKKLYGTDFKKQFSLLTLSESTINHYLELASEVPKYDILLMQIIASRYALTSEENLMEMLLVMLNRRNADENSIIRSYANSVGDVDEIPYLYYKNFTPVRLARKLKTDENDKKPKQRKARKKKEEVTTRKMTKEEMEKYKDVSNISIKRQMQEDTRILNGIFDLKDLED